MGIESRGGAGWLVFLAFFLLAGFVAHLLHKLVVQFGQKWEFGARRLIFAELKRRLSFCFVYFHHLRRRRRRPILSHQIFAIGPQVLPSAFIHLFHLVTHILKVKVSEGEEDVQIQPHNPTQ